MRGPSVRMILMLGEIGVGKTSISRRLVFGTFGDNYKATLDSIANAMHGKPTAEEMIAGKDAAHPFRGF